jgi:hypothetical protein
MAAHSTCITAAIAVALSGAALSSCKVTTSGLRTTHTASARAPVIRHDDPPATQDEELTKRITKEQLATLVGLSLDQARERLKELGHTGSVRVTRLVEEDRKCPREAVCMVQPFGGVPSIREVTLYLNGEFKIAPPPP